MNSNFYTKAVVVFAVLTGFAGWGAAQTVKEMKPALDRAAVQAEKKHRMQTSVVNLNFRWEKEVYLSDFVSRRRPGFKDTFIQRKQKNTSCRGVLVEGGRRVLTPVQCAQAPEGFTLKSVTLLFSNGQKGLGSKRTVSMNGELAEIWVSPQVTKGLKGVPLATVAPGESLADAFGNSVLDELLQFFISRGVVSGRANRITGTKNTLQVGDPFFYQGKVVALVREVPSRLPVSFWGGVSEKPLTLLRTQHQKGLFAFR